MLRDLDIAIAIQGGELHARRKNRRETIVVTLPKNSYVNGKALRMEALESSFRKVISKLLPRIKLVPPRLTISAYFGEDVVRGFIVNCAIASGAREVLALERAMSISIGHEGSEGIEDKKRAYLLWEPGVLEIAGLDGLICSSCVTLEAEMVLQKKSVNEKEKSATSAHFSETGLNQIRQSIMDLKSQGFLENPIASMGSKIT